MKKVVIKIAIALSIGLLIFEISGNISITRIENKIEHIVDTQLVKIPMRPVLSYELYHKLHDAGLYTRTYEDFKTKYGNNKGIEKLYLKLSEDKLYSKSFEEFKEKYYRPRRDTNIVERYIKEIETKKKIKIVIRDHFNKRIAYTYGVITFSVLLLILLIHELRMK